MAAITDALVQEAAITSALVQEAAITNSTVSGMLEVCLNHHVHVLYSGKFSWVQIFTEMPPDPLEEIFVVFIFVGCAHSSDHTPIFTRMYTMSRYVMNVAWLKFHGLYFRCYLSVSKNKNLHLMKISLYTVSTCTCRSTSVLITVYW